MLVIYIAIATTVRYYKGLFLNMPMAPFFWTWILTTCYWEIEHDNGGHFAALENPKDIAHDVRELAEQEWKA